MRRNIVRRVRRQVKIDNDGGRGLCRRAGEIGADANLANRACNGCGALAVSVEEK